MEAGTDTKRLQSSHAFPLGRKDCHCSAEIEKLPPTGAMNDGSGGRQFTFFFPLSEEMLICLTVDGKLRVNYEP